MPSHRTRVAVTALLAATILSGCIDPESIVAPTDEDAPKITVRGHVYRESGQNLTVGLQLWARYKGLFDLDPPKTSIGTDGRFEMQIAIPTNCSTLEVEVQASSQSVHAWTGSSGSLGCPRTDVEVDILIRPNRLVSPVSVLPDIEFRSVDVNHMSTCALTVDNNLWCWGAAPPRHRGNHTFIPEQLSSIDGVVDLTLGATIGCLLTHAGEAYCWGNNTFGELGRGTVGGSASLQRVTSEVPFVSVEAGYRHACGLDDEGRAWCWGDNSQHALGMEETDQECPGVGTPVPCRTTPTEVETELRFEELVVAGSYNCGRTDEGRAYCWGREWGEWDYGDNEWVINPPSSPTPVEVRGDHRFLDLQGSGGGVCGRTVELQIACFYEGHHDAGRRLLDDFTAPFGSGVAEIVSKGPEILCARDGSGFHCWTWTGIPSTWQELPVGEFADIAGGTHTCGINPSGRMFCWGAAYNGQTGVY